MLAFDGCLSQVARQELAHGGGVHAPALCVGGQLVFADGAYAKVTCLGMGEQQSAYRGVRPHGTMLGELYAYPLKADEAVELEVQGLVRQ